VGPDSNSPGVQQALFEDLLAALPAAAQQHVGPLAQPTARLAAAKGLLPLPPRDLLLVLMVALHDAAPEVAKAAAHTLQTVPEKLLLSALGPGGRAFPAALWAPLAQAQALRPTILQAVATHPEAPDAVVADIARSASAELVEMLADNQQRCLRSQALVEALCHNPALRRASLDRVFDFLVRSGIFYPDLPQSAEALARLTPTEVTAAAQQVVLPASVASLLVEAPQAGGALSKGGAVLSRWGAAPAGSGTAPAGSGASTAGGGDSSASGETSTAGSGADITGGTADAVGSEPTDADPQAPAARVPMLKLIGSLNAAQKVALAMKGNKEARSVLIRESNRLIATAVIKNPRITEQEVIGAAKSRSINDEVLRIICASREMTRSYAVRLALVQNPKTPVTVALRLMPGLRQVDLRGLAKSKGVAAGVCKQAEKLLTERS
jgi:hypothetical protein